MLNVWYNSCRILAENGILHGCMKIQKGGNMCECGCGGGKKK